MDRGTIVHGVSKSQTQLNDEHFYFQEDLIGKGPEIHKCFLVLVASLA